MAGYQITRDEALQLSSTGHIEALYYSANQLRAKFCGFRFEMCSMFNIINGTCEEDCHWCPLSKISTIDYASYQTFELDKVIERVAELHGKGVRRIELSAAHHTLNDEQLSEAINYYNAISAKCDIGLCASLGTHIASAPTFESRDQGKALSLQHRDFGALLSQCLHHQRHPRKIPHTARRCKGRF